MGALLTPLLAPAALSPSLEVINGAQRGASLMVKTIMNRVPRGALSDGRLLWTRIPNRPSDVQLIYCIFTRRKLKTALVRQEKSLLVRFTLGPWRVDFSSDQGSHGSPVLLWSHGLRIYFPLDRPRNKTGEISCCETHTWPLWQGNFFQVTW